jgi:hypothetical protein
VCHARGHNDHSYRTGRWHEFAIRSRWGCAGYDGGVARLHHPALCCSAVSANTPLFSSGNVAGSERSESCGAVPGHSEPLAG